ncbi:MAG: DUF4331 domain-containing protein [Mycobacteriales bacterium]
MSGKKSSMGRAAVAVGLSIAAIGASTLLAPTVGYASSHREAPLSSKEPATDATDLYAFVSPDDASMVTLVSNWIPMQIPAGGPNFYQWDPNARYDVNIDNNGDAIADVVYRWVFTSHYRNPNTFLYNTGVVNHLTDPTLNFYQTYDLLELRTNGAGMVKTKTLVDDGISAPSHVGNASMPNYAALRAEATLPLIRGTGKTFAGQADDPFFLDLRVFDLLYGADLSERGNDTLRGLNVNVLALQVPTKELVTSKSPIIGVWTTASMPQLDTRSAAGGIRASGDYVQVSRLGNPLVNEVVIPVGTKDKFNASKPKDDAQFLSFVTDPELPKLIEAIYKIPAPATPRNDLVSVFLTGVEGINKPAGVRPSEQLRLNTSIAPAAAPKRLGVLEGDTAGFPNGRRLTDDVVDIAIQAAEGELVGNPNDLGDLVDNNDKGFGTSFPYVALPHSGSATGASTTAKEVILSAATSNGSNSAGGFLAFTGLAIAAAGVVVSRRKKVAASD